MWPSVRTSRPVLLPDLLDILEVAIQRVDLPLDDDVTESVFVCLIPLFSAFWWHRRIMRASWFQELFLLIKP